MTALECWIRYAPRNADGTVIWPKYGDIVIACSMLAMYDALIVPRILTAIK